MSDEPATCPKCGGEMSQGFIPGVQQGRIGFVSCWLKGPPMKSFWSGVQGLWGGTQIPIGTFRCDNCGFLESYARQEFGVKKV